MDKIVNWIIENQNLILGLLAVWQTWSKARNIKTTVSTKDLLVNALKKENELEVDHKFNTKLMDKIDGIADAMGASKAAVAEAKKSLAGSTRDGGFVKIASYKGKELYLSDVIGAFSFVKKLIK